MKTVNCAPSDAALKTDCISEPLLFQDLGSRKVVADFSGGHLSGDGGALLLRQLDNGLGITRGLAACFQDRRKPELIGHSVRELLAQRIHGLALGYEDLNDHSALRRDPLLAVGAGKTDPLALGRSEADRGKALASPSTLNRPELSNNRKTRCHEPPPISWTGRAQSIQKGLPPCPKPIEPMTTTSAGRPSNCF